MNKQEALSRLTALEQEAKALREIIEAPDVAPSILPAEWNGKGGWYLSSSFAEAIPMCAGMEMIREDQNFFDTKEEAQAWADAISTLIELRRQPGSEAPKEGVAQWVIERDLGVESWAVYYNKIERISPAFSTEEQARAAIDKIGRELLMQMFNTLHGVKR